MTDDHRRAAFALQDGRCGICAAAMILPDPSGGRAWKRLPKARRATWDHLVPRSKGGGDGPDNLHLVCRACNLRRADGPADAGWISVGRRAEDRKEGS